MILKDFVNSRDTIPSLDKCLAYIHMWHNAITERYSSHNWELVLFPAQ